MKTKLTKDLQQAMRDNNDVVRRTLRSIIAAIQKQEANHTVTDADICKILSREANKRQEAIDAYKQHGYLDKCAAEQEELDIINTYRPAPASLNEHYALVRQAVKVVNATSLKDLGMVMKWLNENKPGDKEFSNKTFRMVTTELIG